MKMVLPPMLIQRIVKISGLSFEEALGNGWLRVVHPDDKEKLFKGWQEATRLYHESFSDYRFMRPDGTIAWVMDRRFRKQILKIK